MELDDLLLVLIVVPELALIVLMDEDVSKDTSNWFTLKCDRVLGLYKGMLLEYDPETLAPLGLVVSADELVGKRVAVIDADPSSEPVLQCFDIRPLLNPPPKGQDKLDQLLDWIEQQEPRLDPAAEPKNCEELHAAG